jgi:serine/threonine protein kinase
VERIGKYQIQRLVARGGMGELYLAHDPDLDREVAIKVMSEEISLDPQARARFYREARAAARLQHRNIVTVFDFAHDGEMPYFVMEYLRGQSLAERLQQTAPLTLTETLDLAIQLCEGLQFAHGEGVIHRDIKPGNIWLVEDGGVKVLDFGIATSSAGTLSAGTSVVGSAGYMSPEQIEGQPVDGRSDLFSVGAVLFELVTGHAPFEGDSVTTVMMKIVQEEPAPDVRAFAPDTPPTLAAVIRRALEKDPDQRYTDAAEMVAELRSVRQEIIEHEDLIEDETSTAEQSDATRTAPYFVRQAAPAPSHGPTPFVRHDFVIPHDDYDIRSAEEIRSSVVPDPHPVASETGKRRGVMLFGLGVAAVAAVALGIVVAWPQVSSIFVPPPQFRLVSEPDGAKVIVNGVDGGLRTPADLVIERFPASIRFEFEGYEPLVRQVTEESAKSADRSIRAVLAKLAPVTPAPPPAVEPPAPPPRPLAELKVLRAPGEFAYCPAVIAGARSGAPFDGVTPIRLPAGKYSIRIECAGRPPVVGEIQVPPGKTDRNFDEVITLPSSASPEPQ